MKFLVMTVLMLLVFSSSLCAILEETGSFTGFLFADEPGCEYDRWISHVSEGIAIPEYNLYAPWDRQTNGFGTFHIANASELSQWNRAVTELISGRYEAAQDSLTANRIPYKVIKFNDTDSGRIYYILREDLDLSFNDDQGTTDPNDDESGSFAYGWGLFVYYPMATSPIVVSAVHPNDDFIAPYIAAKAFVEWNAMFFLVAGAGREIVWSGNYSNSSSLSDPSRIDATAFNYAYKLFCDKIRLQFGKREWSAQIHSYDWNRHEGYASNQLSAGSNSSCLNLPIRDLSNLQEDMIHHGSPVMLPANTIGNNQQVSFNDYYAFFNHTYPISYSNADTSFACNTNIDLPGFSMNRQAIYSKSGWNDYDVFDPFLHVEMDELPNCYEQTTENLNWFYGYDPLTASFDLDHVYDKAWAYYVHFVHNITSTLPSVFAMNDNQPPTSPGNLELTGHSYVSINLQWERSYDYDFKTYEIMYSTQPIGTANYSLFTRTNSSILASQPNNQVTVTGLSGNAEYYFKIRARDYNGNISGESNMVTATTSFTPPVVQMFMIGGNVLLSWNAIAGAASYRIYRADDPFGSFTLVTSVTRTSYTIPTDAQQGFYKVTAFH